MNSSCDNVLTPLEELDGMSVQIAFGEDFESTADKMQFTDAVKISVPEPTSTFGLLTLGTLGAASTLKRKLKSSKSAEKETTKVG